MKTGVVRPGIFAIVQCLKTQNVEAASRFGGGREGFPCGEG